MANTDHSQSRARYSGTSEGGLHEVGAVRFFRRKVALEEIPLPSLARLFAWWNDQCRGRAMPARSDFGPADIGFMLGRLHLVDVEMTPLRLKFRLTGSETVLRLGFDPTGRYVDDIEPRAYAKLLSETYLEAIALKAPICNYVHCVVAGRESRYLHLLLPLSEDGQRVNMLMIGASGNREWHDAYRKIFEANATPR